MAKLAFWCAFASSALILFSIAASQILLGLAIVSMLGARVRWKFPPVAIAFAVFLLGTLISLLLSQDPLAGLPQIRKFYVYLILPVTYSLFGRVAWARNLLLVWSLESGIASVIGIAQFAHKWQTARALHVGFYEYYLDARITGTMGHWMTFSGEEMLALLGLLAFLCFGRLPAKSVLLLLWAIVAFMLAALLLSDTRSVWIATFAAALYLTYTYKRKLVLLVPVVAVLAFLLGPSTVRDRLTSIVRPHGTVDSNQFRFVVWRTGLRIIEAHPIFGLGPELVHRDFYQWLPPDTPRPLPSGYYGHLHSIYVHYAAERGIPTMLAIVWIFCWIVRDCRRSLRALLPGRSDARFILHLGVAAVLALAIEGFFELNLGDSEVLTMFLILTAFVYVAVSQSRLVRVRL